MNGASASRMTTANLLTSKIRSRPLRSLERSGARGQAGLHKKHLPRCCRTSAWRAMEKGEWKKSAVGAVDGSGGCAAAGRQSMNMTCWGSPCLLRSPWLGNPAWRMPARREACRFLGAALYAQATHNPRRFRSCPVGRSVRPMNCARFMQKRAQQRQRLASASLCHVPCWRSVAFRRLARSAPDGRHPGPWAGER